MLSRKCANAPASTPLSANPRYDFFCRSANLVRLHPSHIFLSIVLLQNYPFPATTRHQPHRSAPNSSAFHPAQPASSTSAPVSTPSGSAFAQFVPVQPAPSRSQDSIHAPELVQQPMPASRSLTPSRTFPLSQRFEQATPMMRLDMWNSGLASQSPQGGQEAQFDLASSTSPELRTLFAKLDAAGPHDLSTSV